MDQRVTAMTERESGGIRPMWRRMAAVLPALVVTALLAGGCSSSLQQRVALLDEENTQLRSELLDRNDALDSMQRDLDVCRNEQVDLQAAAEAAQRDADAARSAAASAPRAGTVASDGGSNAFNGIDGVRGTVRNGEVTAVVEGDILFDSGATTLKTASKRSLDEVADVIRRRFAGRTVRVTGHTDSDPIVKTKDKFPTNHHLGFERAFAVRDYLISRGISADQISIESLGPDRPQGSKRASRRVEISIVSR
ncbi:MAG: OmpA family protein [Phycisphaerales bacterium]